MIDRGAMPPALLTEKISAFARSPQLAGALV
jgi:hypothetical protein